MSLLEFFLVIIFYRIVILGIETEGLYLESNTKISTVTEYKNPVVLFYKDTVFSLLVDNACLNRISFLAVLRIRIRSFWVTRIRENI